MIWIGWRSIFVTIFLILTGSFFNAFIFWNLWCSVYNRTHVNHTISRSYFPMKGDVTFVNYFRAVYLFILLKFYLILISAFFKRIWVFMADFLHNVNFFYLFYIIKSQTVWISDALNLWHFWLDVANLLRKIYKVIWRFWLLCKITVHMRTRCLKQETSSETKILIIYLIILKLGAFLRCQSSLFSVDYHLIFIWRALLIILPFDNTIEKRSKLFIIHFIYI